MGDEETADEAVPVATDPAVQANAGQDPIAVDVETMATETHTPDAVSESGLVSDLVDPDADVEGDLDIDGDPASLEISDEAVVALIAERDDYLDRLQRLKAEFDNARRRNAENAEQMRKQAASDIVEKLLPVLDSCDAALAQGFDQVAPIATSLFDTLSAQGLARFDPTGEAFNPEHHEAVLHEEGEGDPTVAETLRTGYVWNDRVIRPAMVKVQG